MRSLPLNVAKANAEDSAVREPALRRSALVFHEDTVGDLTTVSSLPLPLEAPPPLLP